MIRPTITRLFAYKLEDGDLYATEKEAVGKYVQDKLDNIGYYGSDGDGVLIRNFLEQSELVIELLQMWEMVKDHNDGS